MSALPLSPSTRGLFLGFLGVLAFAITLPMTRLAAAREGYAGLDPVFITAGRAALAGFLSIAYLGFVRARWPDRREFSDMALAGLGVVIGFPLFMALAVQRVDAVHASVIAGGLPLATAILAALLMGQRASWRFWCVVILGFALVLLYAWIAGDQARGFSIADLLLLAAVMSAGFGYVMGARAGQTIEPERVICWITVIYLPLTIPVALYTAPQAPVLPQAWLGFGYVTLFSMWLGFFAWYRGLAADPMRVSQVQLLQPFLSMVFAIPILGETMTPMAVLFCLAIVLTVGLSRKLK